MLLIKPPDTDLRPPYTSQVVPSLASKPSQPGISSPSRTFSKRQFRHIPTFPLGDRDRLEQGNSIRPEHMFLTLLCIIPYLYHSAANILTELSIGSVACGLEMDCINSKSLAGQFPPPSLTGGLSAC